jgi:hypothetical protein
MKFWLRAYILIFLLAFEVYASTKEECSIAINVVSESAWKGIRTKEQIDNAINACLAPANDGDLKSQYDLSILYLLNNNEEESEESYYWVLMAAKKGHAYAQYRLATMYENGIVIKKNTSQADNWFTKSAANDFLLSQKKLGNNYTSDDQTEAVFLKGIYWLEKAADQGDKMSIIRLINIYSKGSKHLTADKKKVDYWNERYLKIF